METRIHCIFFSYGHDHNEELVRLIKTDLEKRGHDMWFDKNEIKFGDEWRRSITDGIVGSNRVLSFLSKHSTRDPGVCRDEIAIAIGVKGGNIQTILVDDEKEVQAPVNIGHIQWLDMHEWKSKQLLGETIWNEWYQSKFDEIIRVVESDESRRFAGEIELLNLYLKPIKSDSRIYALLNKGFIGREWLFEAVENWRKDNAQNSRLFWITGDPGVGKSAFAAQLTHTHGDSVIAAQFVEWDKPDHRNAQNVIQSIAFQLATRLPDYRKFLLTLPEIKELERKNPSELFDYLLAKPLKHAIDGGRERYLIVIDALDEARESGHNPLVELLARDAHRLPDWLGIIVTSRPESAVKTPLQGLNPFVLDTGNEANKNDIRDYLLYHLASQLKDRAKASQIIEQILENSEGVFLYAERFCEDVRQNHISLDHPNQFPQGLGGIFFQYFQRQFPNREIYEKTIEPMLGAILAAREPLPVEILQKLFNWKETEHRKWLRILGSLFPVTTETGCEVIKPYHKSLADCLADENKAGEYFVSVMEGHELLSSFYFNNWQNERTSLFEVIFQLLKSNQIDKAKILLFDEYFLDLKLNLLGIKAVLSDFILAEKSNGSYIGLVGVACHLLQIAKNEERTMHDLINRYPHLINSEKDIRISNYILKYKTLFSKTCIAVKKWNSEGVVFEKYVKFCTETIRTFIKDLPLVTKVVEYIRKSDFNVNSQKTDTLRAELSLSIAEAKNAPRIRSGYSGMMADTAWKHLDYVENALIAADCALSLHPLSMLVAIWEARRSQAIADCDMDPYGAINLALDDAHEALHARFTFLLETL